MLIKKPPVLITTELNIAKELETWLKKVETLSLEDSITTLEPLLQTELQKQADANDQVHGVAGCSNELVAWTVGRAKHRGRMGQDFSRP